MYSTSERTSNARLERVPTSAKILVVKQGTLCQGVPQQVVFPLYVNIYPLRYLSTLYVNNRLYAFSSGSKFAEVSDALQDWIATAEKAFNDYESGDDDDEVHSRTHTYTNALTHSHAHLCQGDPVYDPKKALKQLKDVDGLYNILGNTVIAFMREKPQPFLKDALASKQNFWRVPTFKRGVTFVFLIRYVLGFKSQNQWKRFTSADYKLNTRCFKRWNALEHKVFEQSEAYNDLPEATEPEEEVLKRRASSSFSESSPVKRKFVINDDSTDED